MSDQRGCLAPSFRPANLRAIYGWPADPIGLGFNLADGEVVRVSMTRAEAARMALLLMQCLGADGLECMRGAEKREAGVE